LPATTSATGGGAAVVVAKADVPDLRGRGPALGIAGGAVAVTVLVVFGAVMVPRARRRRLRAG
jgi:hypothetical protein